MDKLDERIHFQRFQDSYPDCPEGIACEDERPDFLLRVSTGLLGIEVTQLFQQPPITGLPRQAVERLQRQVMDQARARYDAAGAGRPSLDVAVMFQPGTPTSPNRVSELAAHLADQALLQPIAEGETRRYEPTIDNYSQFPAELSYARFSHFSQMTRPQWSVVDGGYMMPCTPDLLTCRISEKERRIAAYRVKCDQAWLLLVLDGFAISSMLEVPEETIAHRYVSSFDRILLFDNFRRVTWRLSLTGRTSSLPPS
jgi:hypothetical protein